MTRIVDPHVIVTHQLDSVIEIERIVERELGDPDVARGKEDLRRPFVLIRGPPKELVLPVLKASYTSWAVVWTT